MRKIFSSGIAFTYLAILSSMLPNFVFAQEFQIDAPVAQESTKTREVTLAQMGRPKGYQLNGIITTANLNSGVRLDELIVDAKMRLRMIYPPGMTYSASYLRVMVNGQLAGVHQLQKEKAGIYHTVELPLQSNLFSDFAEVQIQFLGSPGDLGNLVCWSPSHPSLRLDISPDSALILTTKPLAIVNDLALLPAPFFDPRDQKKLNLPLILPESNNLNVMRASGILASWFGAQASYRQAQFEVVNDLPASRHAVILSLGKRLPSYMSADNVQGPTLAMDSNPEQPHIKRLYVIGRNEDELMKAVQGLVLEVQALSGRTAVIQDLELPEPRQAYDAPRYVPTNRSVRFSELMDYSTQLEMSAESPEAALNLRLPPDLFSWAGKNVDMSLRYRYTAPSDWNDSLLTVEINNNLLQSMRLPPRKEQNENRFNLNLLGQSSASNEEALKIPAFRVGGSNEIKFKFSFAEEGTRSCNGQPLQARGSIDPESTLDFSDLPHYIQMPNLAAFANGGYPFSIYADLGQTAIVVPPNPTQGEYSQFLNLMGLFGQWTGIPSTLATIIPPEELPAHPQKNWVAIGPIERMDWLEPHQLDMPMMLQKTKRSLGSGDTAKWLDGFWNNNTENLTPADQGRAFVQTSGSLGAIMGFESPFSPSKAGLVITGTDNPSFVRAMQALSDYGDIAKVRGSLTLLRGETIQSFRVGDTYIAGSLPWHMRIRIAFAEYPALIAVSGILAGMIIAVGLFGWLSGRARRKSKEG